jgi:diguanylate cyclase (GGDEF)-like protein/PAS domain S-box-containing protein
LVSISAMLISISSIGYLVFTSWFLSARQTTESIAGEINERIYEQINSFMHVPEHMNEVNYKIIENGILDLSDEIFREKFFVGVLSSHNEEIYSFSYGTVNGEYYGARRNENGVIEIMRNDASTGGNSWYYSVKEDLTAGELIVKAGKFDPRTRAWYKAAVETGDPALSPVYKHFVMDDLTISAAWPIYDSSNKLQGVLGTHMLLSGIGDFLQYTVHDYNGYAVIAEKDTGALIANSMGIDNFTVLPDGTFKRYSISEIDNSDIRQAYDYYQKNHQPNFIYKSENEKYHVNIRETDMEGFNWVVISAIPEGILIAPAVKSIYSSILLALLALLLSLVLYNIVASRLLKPVGSLLQVSRALSSGDLSKRAKIVRNDEIGNISKSLNQVADKMQYLINNLESSVKERTEELHEANVTLEENKNRLQLILDSTAEAIYGIDLEGNCTFCNNSCIKLLGYNSPEELLGKNMHQQIHHSFPDGTPFPVDNCRITLSMIQGEGHESNDEVFWRADGTSFEVEYHSFPQIKDAQVIGSVITFLDITERKKREAAIEYLSCHDTLTGFYNRRCFEEKRPKIDVPENLPLSVIYADINGLKMTNDIFGHTAGDELIKKTSEILKQSCRETDVLTRIGGDEFIILLPRTDDENAEKILSRIRNGFLNTRVAAIKCSISLGCDTKTKADQSLEEIMRNAEYIMYKDKALNRQSTNKDIIDTLVETLHSKSASEKLHSIIVSELCGKVGSALHLPEPEISKLERAGYLHDIGKITLEESILSKEFLTEEEMAKMRQHSVVGYRILNLFDDTLDLAEYVYSHHERWDGSGYPGGLKGEQIPLISRIISIAETYERVLNRGELDIEERKKAALMTIKEGAGTQFDPQIAELFVEMMKE